MEGGQHPPGDLPPSLPGEKAHAPGVGLDFAAQIDEMNFCHPVSPLKPLRLKLLNLAFLP